MKNIFTRSNFDKTKGGNLYEYKEAETTFAIAEDGFYVIKVIAKAKNAKQNNSADDDDLRMTIDDYSFGKYKQNKDQISFKGFNTSASWNGAILKNEPKAVYFFLNLKKGSHILKFFADNTPSIISIEIFEVENLNFQLDFTSCTKYSGFIFLNTYPKGFQLNLTKSFNSKSIEVSLNGIKIETSDKIDNSNKTIHFNNEEIIGNLPFENSIELHLTEPRNTTNLEINFFNLQEFITSIKDTINFKKYVKTYVWLATFFFKYTRRPYSTKFLEHSLIENPSPLIFKANHPFVRKIKADPTFIQIIASIKHKIASGYFEGEIIPSDINFNTKDLATTIHGIKKIEYTSTQNKNHKYNVKMILYDIYDFQPADLPPFPHSVKAFKALILDGIDKSEELHIINNYEVQIFINITI